MYLVMKFRKSQTKFSRNSRKSSLQFQRRSRMESGICIIVERREIIQKRKARNFQIAPKCAAFNSWLFFGGGVIHNLLKAAKRQAS